MYCIGNALGPSDTSAFGSNIGLNTPYGNTVGAVLDVCQVQVNNIRMPG